jgi:hypothetical protein
MNTLESAIAEARRVGSPLHAALSAIVGTEPVATPQRRALSAFKANFGEAARSWRVADLINAVLVVRDGVYQWREPKPLTDIECSADCPAGTHDHADGTRIIVSDAAPKRTPCPGPPTHLCPGAGCRDCQISYLEDQRDAMRDQNLTLQMELEIARQTKPEIPDDGGPLMLRTEDTVFDIGLYDGIRLAVSTYPGGTCHDLTDDEALTLARMLTVAVQRRRARKAGGK